MASLKAMQDFITNAGEKFAKQLGEIAKPPTGKKFTQAAQKTYNEAVENLYNTVKSSVFQKETQAALNMAASTNAEKKAQQKAFGELKKKFDGDEFKDLWNDFYKNIESKHNAANQANVNTERLNKPITYDIKEENGKLTKVDISSDEIKARKNARSEKVTERIVERQQTDPNYEPKRNRTKEKDSSPFDDLWEDEDGQMTLFGNDEKTKQDIIDAKKQEVARRHQQKVEEAKPEPQIKGQDEFVVNETTGDLTTKNERQQRQQEYRDAQVAKDSRSFGQRVKDTAKGAGTAVVETFTGNGDDASKRFRGRNKRKTEYQAAQEHFRVTGEGKSQTPGEFRRNYNKPPEDKGDYITLAEYTSKQQAEQGSGIPEWIKNHQLAVAGGIAAASLGVGVAIGNSRDGD